MPQPKRRQTAVPRRRVVEDRVFTGETIRLDGCHFVRCIFRDSVVEFSGEAAFGMVDCSIEHCEWVMRDAAERTLFALAAMYQIEGFGEVVERTLQDIRDGIGGHPRGAQPPTGGYDA